MSKIILDASALLAFLNMESGGEQVQSILEKAEAVISSVNLAEVATKLLERGMPLPAIKTALQALELTIVDFTDEHAYTSAELREPTRSAGLSLGDRACLVTARSLSMPAVTADRAWLEFDLDIDVRCIRPN